MRTHLLRYCSDSYTTCVRVPLSHPTRRESVLQNSISHYNNARSVLPRELIRSLTRQNSAYQQGQLSSRHSVLPAKCIDNCPPHVSPCSAQQQYISACPREAPRDIKTRQVSHVHFAHCLSTQSQRPMPSPHYARRTCSRTKWR